METKRKTPELHSPNALSQLNIGFPTSRGKDTKRFFQHPIRQKIYELFLSGGQYSVTELSKLLNIPDPRSHIRYLRDAGVYISDYWVKTKFSKYKVYFIHQIA